MCFRSKNIILVDILLYYNLFVLLKFSINFIDLFLTYFAEFIQNVRLSKIKIKSLTWTGFYDNFGEVAKLSRTQQGSNSDSVTARVRLFKHYQGLSRWSFLPFWKVKSGMDGGKDFVGYRFMGRDRLPWHLKFWGGKSVQFDASWGLYGTCVI